MDGTLRADGVVELGGDARQRFYDSRGYGDPLDGNRLAVAPVEAAHLLSRGDLDAVDGMCLRDFLARVDVREFVVYRDLRDRGFYLTPARFVDDRDAGDDVDFVVYPRGEGPWDDSVAYRIRVV
ncbi:MAG: tRNA-intron lyase, partial [Candidatus Nanohaloarchaea archaeon]